MPRNVCFLIIIASLIAATTIEYRSESQTAKSYIVQANGLDQAMALVGNVGGDITRELGIIDAVGARLMP
ncbi:MAG: hypothetical protein OER22_06440 [Gammaproteobacteria bacterium]|nr:hypothetical protein [Gammaproteobacteria bacterium]MDH3552237.1 hypothetical protein [Gammaproteobacteria bacterium]